MKTYLSLWFNSEGGRPSKVTTKLIDLGFEPTTGAYDYIYDWEKGVPTDEILRVGNKVQKALKNEDVLFNLETL